jgi:hypothetical protein
MKMNETIHRNWGGIQRAFLAYRTEFTGQQSAPFEGALIVLI